MPSAATSSFQTEAVRLALPGHPSRGCVFIIHRMNPALEAGRRPPNRTLCRSERAYVERTSFAQTTLWSAPEAPPSAEFIRCLQAPTQLLFSDSTMGAARCAHLPTSKRFFPFERWYALWSYSHSPEPFRKISGICVVFVPSPNIGRGSQ